jgi:threonine dehydrogenase-like Zn-dependent dehydrogenase
VTNVQATFPGRLFPGRLPRRQTRNRVLDGRIDPGKVFDLTLPLDEVAEAYRAMDERHVVKVLLQP